MSKKYLAGPGGVVTRWQLRRAQAGRLRDDEAQHAQQLVRH